ncbi:MAG: VanZ family protein [Deltaproteobacteria bacterium]|nr:VanZ family protein [Deltaproteobacteria bacterium]MBI4794831.1 VanZ family protein [Deltaproteobacteria bacterium]
MQAPSVRQFCFYWLPPLLFTGGILTLSGDLGSSARTQELIKWFFSWIPFLELEQLQEGHGYLRKAGHVMAYGSLYWLWFRAFLWRFSPRLRPAILWSLGFCLLTAMMDEGHQALEASRQGRILDVALDFGAAALAALALSFKRI